jgi:Dockerin type I domain
MIQKKSLAKQIAIVAVTAPVAMALDNPEPPANQGTIGRQRPILTDYSNTGWLSDHADPRFWFWDLQHLEDNGGYAPSDNRYPGARRWAQQWINPQTSYFNANGDVDVVKIEMLADSILDKILSRMSTGDIEPGDPSTFAMHLQRLGDQGELFDHELDKLQDIPENSNGDIYDWDSTKKSEYRGTPWRSEGVTKHNKFFAALVSALDYKIDVYNSDESHIDKIPDLSRFIVDEELNWGLGAGQEVIAVYSSTIRDSSRYTSETLLGDFSNWTSNTNPKVSDIMGGFNPSYSATPHSWNNHTTPNSLSDINQLRDMTTHRSMINAVLDGALEASIESTLHTTWQGIKWSNYEVSGWYTEQYPMFIRSENGGLYPNSPGPDPHLFGWNFRAWNGSADMQSPVLYPPNPSQTSEFENPSYPGTASTDDQVMEAGVRLSRLQLDHAIFSFDDIAQAPRHIVPWVPHVGSPVNQGAIPEVSKKYTRDIIALCKAKGVNEILFWGNSTTHSESKPRWIATNDALSQVWDYNLKRVVVWPGNIALSASDLTQMTYSEEHTFDLSVLDTTSTSVTAQMEVEFDVEESLGAGTEYTLILETLDGGGPWSDAQYTVKIRNFQTGQYGAYEPVTAVYEEMNDISTRRVVFTDDPGDTDTLYDDWGYEFDDESLSIPNVQDRKSIHKWVITLPGGSLSDYLYEHSTQGWKKMKFQITATHDSPPSFGQPDPLRIDLLQLYESELIDNNVMPSVTIQSAGGDLNNDGMIDVLDLMHFIRVLSIDKADPSLDINQDGRLNEDDLDELVAHLKEFHLE